jgi:hypothetical protein
VKKAPKQHPGTVQKRTPRVALDPYGELLSGVVRLIEEARLATVRSVNVVLTSTYWRVGQRLVEHEQAGSERAGYGEALLKWLAQDLTARLGRGFSERNLRQMRLFYLGWPITQTVSAEFAEAGIRQTPSAKSVTGPVSRYLGPTMSDCSPSPIPEHENTTSARHCSGAGPPVNSTVRLPVLPTKEPAQDRDRTRKSLCPPMLT